MELPKGKQAQSILGSNARINIWDGSVRSGKTVGSILRWLDYVSSAPKGDLLMVAKTERTLKRNILNPIFDLLDEDEYDYKEGKGELIIYDRMNLLVGANDERAEGKIRGSTIAGCYGDELTLWPESFFVMMLSRLSVKGAKFFGTTNADSPNHWLKVLFLNRIEELDLKLWNFLLEDNDNLDPGYVESIKKEYTGLWYKRFILGLWVLAEGAIYDFFDKDLHCSPEEYYAVSYYISVDYGTSNPTAFGLYGVNLNLMPKIWKIKEYYWDSKKQQRQKTDSEYSKDLISFKGDAPIAGVIVDPSAASFRLQLERDGVSSIAANNEVFDGLCTQARMLKDGEYVIHPDCKQTISDYYGYVWDAKAQKKGEDKPLKLNDHTKDEERYILHTLFGSQVSGDTVAMGEMESTHDEW